MGVPPFSELETPISYVLCHPEKSHENCGVLTDWPWRISWKPHLSRLSSQISWDGSRPSCPQPPKWKPKIVPQWTKGGWYVGKSCERWFMMILYVIYIYIYLSYMMLYVNISPFTNWFLSIWKSIHYLTSPGKKHFSRQRLLSLGVHLHESWIANEKLDIHLQWTKRLGSLPIQDTDSGE